MGESAEVTTFGGDDGTSSLLDGARRPKDDPAFDAVGNIDAAQVAVGAARRALLDAKAGRRVGGRDARHLAETTELLERIQRDLITAGGILAYGNAVPDSLRLDDSRLPELTEAVERWRERVHIGREFVIAGGSWAGVELDRARTVVRQAERSVVAVVRGRGIEATVQVSRYLNRLSDVLFILARWSDNALQ